MQDHKVISFGHSLAPLIARNQRLTDAGFHVCSAWDEASARSLINNGDSTALVIGHMIPELVRNRLAREAKRSNPGIVVIMLYDGKINNASMADAVLNVVTADQNLVETVRHLVLQKAESKPSRRPAPN